MKLYIKQQLFRLTDTYDIFDEDGEQKYYAKCDFSFAFHKLRVRDQFEEFGFVQQRFNLFVPKFSFFIYEQCLGDIVKDITLFRPSYSMDFNGWRIQGDFLAMDYTVYDQNNNIVMTFQKELFSFGDRYCLNIVDEKNERLCVLIALAVDMALCCEDR